MGNVLKSEFYKLTHSKKYYVFYGIALVLWLATFILRMIAKTDSGWLAGLTGDGFFRWDIFVIVFGVVYVNDDFKSGYVKNIYFSANKFCYVFSKFICLFILLFACAILSFISEVIVALAYVKGAAVNDSSSSALSYFSRFVCTLFSYLARISVVVFFTYLINDVFYVISGWFFYSMFICTVIYNILNEILSFIFGTNACIDTYFPFSGSGASIVDGDYLSWLWFIIAYLVWIAVSALGSVLIYSKRRVKV